MQSETSSKLNTKFEFNSIQCLRFIAAFLVVVLHATFYTKERLDPSIELYNSGGNRVPLFFVISGFVMVLSSQNLISNNSGWKIFAVKRIVRIVPIYWIITSLKLLVMFVSIDFVLHSQLDWGYILKSYFFIPAYNKVDGNIAPLLGVGWTLNFEMFFYLLFTLSLLFKFNSVWFAGFILAILSVLSIFKTSDWPAAGFYANPIILDYLFGMIAGQLIMKGNQLSKNISILLIIPGLSILLLPLYKYFSFLNNVYLLGVTYFFLVYGCVSLERKVKVFVPDFVLFFGRASYSLYLVHSIIAPIVPTLLKRFGLMWPITSILISIILAIIAGALCYYFLERPISKALNGYIKNFNFFPRKLSSEQVQS